MTNAFHFPVRTSRADVVQENIAKMFNVARVTRNPKTPSETPLSAPIVSSGLSVKVRNVNGSSSIGDLHAIKLRRNKNENLKVGVRDVKQY